jgi:hypothetical protein
MRQEFDELRARVEFLQRKIDEKTNPEEKTAEVRTIYSIYILYYIGQ